MENHGCTGSCHTCGSNSNCGEERKPSFFDRMEKASEIYDKVGEDEILRMLNEAVAELEAADAEADAAKAE